MGFLPPRANRVSILLLAIRRLRDPPATGGGGRIDTTEAAGAIPAIPLEELFKECDGREELRSAAGLGGEEWDAGWAWYGTGCCDCSEGYGGD